MVGKHPSPTLLRVYFSAYGDIGDLPYIKSNFIGTEHSLK